MRGESNSRSRSPSDYNNNRGDRGDRNDRVSNDCAPSNKVYACFLPEDIQENQLKDIFEECGTVQRVFLKKKQDGFTFAYVTYQEVNQAKRAIEKLNRRKIGEKSIKVQFARERTQSKEGDGGRGGDRDRGRGGRGGFHQGDSDTRKRFDGGNGGEYQDRGRGRPRGNGFGNSGDDRGGRFREGGNRQGGFDRGNDRGNDRGPMKCFKCQKDGHMARSCPNEGQDNDRRSRDQGQGQRGGDYKPRPRVEKMSEDECDY